MKVENYKKPKSSFLSIDKDLSIIIEKMLKNERLKKLIYYNSPDALNRENLSDKESISLINKNIKIIPKIQVDDEIINYILISFDNFMLNKSNPEFRDNTISFDIICHLEQWQLEDSQLRPYRIAAEIDSMLDKEKLTGLGRLEFAGAAQIILNEKFAGLSLMYNAIHGEEDKQNMLNPADEEQFLQDFKEMLLK